MAPEPDEIPVPQRLALAYAPLATRPAAHAAFMLDARLGRFVAQAKEPMVAQLRLAWWRDQLNAPAAARALGDAVLDALSDHWGDAITLLVPVVDGWEQLLAEPPLPEDALFAFSDGRATLFDALAARADISASPEISDAGRLWALADHAARSSDEEERAFIVSAASAACSALPPRLPRNLRHLTILAQLAHTSLRRGGAPFMSKRRDALRIMRLGMFGR